MINNTAISQNIFTPAQQIIFIDSQVEDYQLLAAGVIPGIETVILEHNRDGIEQITAVLQRKDNLTAVHIVSHGSPGCLYLGNSQLSLNSLNKYQLELQTWFSSSSLIPHPSSFLIYGCNVAAGDAGEEFITKLHSITGAEIAASTTPIGNGNLGGNWELDVATNKVDNLAFTPATQAAYSSIFAIYDNTNAETITTGNTVTKTFNVTENVTINNINLGLNVTHNNRGDLQVTLISPLGTSVQLISSSSDTDDNYDLLLTDLSTNPIDNNIVTEDTAAPIYQENYLAAPSNPFSTFDGENSTGTWTLTIENLSGTTSGGRDLTFNSSRLGINTPPWNPNPYNGGILVRGAAFISCGTITDNGLDSPVLAVDRVDIDANGNAVVPTTGEATVANPLTWSHQDWTQEKLGNVYGLDVDLQGNMYAAASANYGAGFGFGTGANQATAQINYGSIGGSLAGGQGGKTENSSDPTIEANELSAAGTIYKMDAVTGEPTVFAVLPQQSTTVTNIAAETADPDIVRNNTGVGLGNIHHDKVHDQFFVSNFEDGRIYRLDSSGNILDSYDPGTLDDGTAGVVPLSELVYGLTVSPDGNQLFFGKNRTVYSIDLNPDGSFPGSVDNSTNITDSTWDNYAGATETDHETIPAIQPPGFTGAPTTENIISDLDFLPTGELLVGTRVYEASTIFSSYNHGGHNYTFEYNATSDKYSDINEIEGFSTSSQFGGDDGYGGISYSKQLDDSFDYAFSSADIITEPGPQGIAVFPDNASNLADDGVEITPR
ncbi:MAG: DUF4347 domain-containing protein, partial [Pleurocapsa sp. MO_192.B19]|nr:DUF4347 domain-containing protein [Pleurocapsa sp. MO_192.B19]